MVPTISILIINNKHVFIYSGMRVEQKKKKNDIQIINQSIKYNIGIHI